AYPRRCSASSRPAVRRSTSWITGNITANLMRADAGMGECGQNGVGTRRRAGVVSYGDADNSRARGRLPCSKLDLSRIFLTEITGSTENCLPGRDARAGAQLLSILDPK